MIGLAKGLLIGALFWTVGGAGIIVVCLLYVGALI